MIISHIGLYHCYLIILTFSLTPGLSQRLYELGNPYMHTTVSLHIYNYIFICVQCKINVPLRRKPELPGKGINYPGLQEQPIVPVFC